MQKRLRKRLIIASLSIVSMGLVLFIGDQLISDSVSEQIVLEESKNEKSRGKYAEENSEKAKFLSAKNLNSI